MLGDSNQDMIEPDSIAANRPFSRRARDFVLYVVSRLGPSGACCHTGTRSALFRGHVSRRHFAALIAAPALSAACISDRCKTHLLSIA